MSNFNDIINSEKPVLVDFFATWCGPCQMLLPVLNQVKDSLQDRITIIKIDVDKNQDLAQKQQVRGVPTMMLFQNGKQLWRQSGVLTKEEIINIMDFNLDSITEESKTGYEAIASNGSEIKADESLDCFEYELDFTSKNSEQSESHDHIALDISNISDKSPIYAQSTSLNELSGNNLFQRNFYSNEPVTVNYDKQNNYFDLTDMETKLELVKAYIDMNDSDGAKATANEVLENGTAEQKKIAEALMKGLK
jgi:thioredoxin 1